MPSPRPLRPRDTHPRRGRISPRYGQQRRARAARIRIGDSPAAPLPTLIAGPSEETRRVRETKKELGERHEIRLRWWNELLDRATQLHAAISPSRYGSVGTGVGKRGLSLNYDVAQHETRIELYIDRGRRRDGENLEAFEALRVHQEEIATAFGASLVWQLP